MRKEKEIRRKIVTKRKQKIWGEIMSERERENEGGRDPEREIEGKSDREREPERESEGESVSKIVSESIGKMAQQLL